MRSESQIKASQVNGAKSKGPNSISGKEKSSRNATGHGLLSRAIVLDGESRERFTFLLTSLQREFQPQSVVESNLVENMAVARWRQMRLWSMENASISHEIRRQAENPASPENANNTPATRAALAFRSLSDNSRTLDVFNRYESRFDRQYARALDRLIRIRENRNLAKRTQEVGPLAD